MANGTTHVVGAGLAGMSAAVELLQYGRKVVVHEMARHAGGRCRSYFEPSLGLVIDNGNHLLLSGNRSALSFLDRIGGRHLLTGPETSEFTFFDLKSGERWVLRPNEGPLPWWIFSPQRRVPKSRAHEYLALARLLVARERDVVTDRVDRSSGLYERLLRPVLLAALNCEPDVGSAQLAGAVIRETLAKGGQACRPLIAAHGLGPALIDPAIAFIARRGGNVRFDHALRALDFDGDRIRGLDFGDETVKLDPHDSVILAVPGWVARTFVPGLKTPNEYKAILNAHFKIEPPRHLARITGIINATTEWLFAFDDRLSVTVSAADRFNEAEREPLARQIWSEIAKIADLPLELPPWQIVKERRATFAATPEQNVRRPVPSTGWKNLFLAGDWIATGLPATIEGAIRSGETAAKLAMDQQF